MRVKYVQTIMTSGTLKNKCLEPIRKFMRTFFKKNRHYVIKVEFQIIETRPHNEKE